MIRAPSACVPVAIDHEVGRDERARDHVVDVADRVEKAACAGVVLDQTRLWADLRQHVCEPLALHAVQRARR